MLKPHYEEEFKWFDLEFYNAEDVAARGDHANIKIYSSDILPTHDELKKKAKELGFDSLRIKECIEIHRDYYFDKNGESNV